MFTVNSRVRYQQILGFGGAVTDAAAINIASLSEGAREKLLRAYYAPEGRRQSESRWLRKCNTPVLGTCAEAWHVFWSIRSLLI